MIDWKNKTTDQLLEEVSKISDEEKALLIEEMRQSIQASETPERIQYWKDKVSTAQKYLSELKRLNGLE